MALPRVNKKVAEIVIQRLDRGGAIGQDGVVSRTYDETTYSKKRSEVLDDDPQMGMNHVPLPVRLVALAVWCVVLGIGKVCSSVWRLIRKGMAALEERRNEN